MIFIKFTSVKLIPHIISVICVISLLFSINSSEAQHVSVRAGSSQPPVVVSDSVLANRDTGHLHVKGSIPSLPPKKEPALPKETLGNRMVLWILGDSNVYQLKQDLITYGDKHLPLLLRNAYTQAVEKTYSYPIALFFIFLIIVLLFNVLMVLLILYYSNQYKNRREKYICDYANLYEEVLRSYLFGEIDWENARLKLKKLNKPLKRRVLASVLLDFQKNLRGGMDSQISMVYSQLNLQEDAVKLTRSGLYYKRVQGIKELTSLCPEKAEQIVAQYINSPNDMVRAEAQTSYIPLHPDKPFDFLRNLTSPFTRWTQINAFYLFRLHELPVPSFVDYLHSENPKVRNFCLRMITYFQQLENTEEIFSLLDSPMDSTRFLCIRAINDLRLFQGKELLKQKYSGETGKNRLEIIRAFKNIGDEYDFDFLESIIQTGTVSEKTEACRSLCLMNPAGEERLIFLARQDDNDLEKYLAHVTDPRN